MSVSKEAVLPRWDHSRRTRQHRSRDWLLLFGVFALGTLWLSWPSIKHFQTGQRHGCHDSKKYSAGLPLKSIPSHLQYFQDCSIKNLRANLSFLDTAHPLPVSEFVERRDRLAQALDVEGLDAFLVEPGYTFSYYGNVSIHRVTSLSSGR